MKNLKYILSTALIGFLVACSGAKEEVVAEETSKELTLTDQQIKFNGITMSSLEEREFAPIVHAFGKVEVPPQNKTVITAKFGGFVKKIYILDGMKVKKGQTLVEIEDPSILQMQQDYLENQSALEFLKAEFERQDLLYMQQATSAKNFQEAKANYLTSKAKQTGLKSKLSMAGVNVAGINENAIQTTISLKAPFNGIVTKVNVQMGSYVQSQDQLLELIDTQHAHAELFVYEKDINLVAEGQKITMNFSNKKETMGGTVYLIGHDIAQDKTVKVHGHFDKENSEIIPGAFFKANIKTSAQNFLSLPASAVINNKGTNLIFMLLEKKGTTSYFKAIEVEVLGQNDEFVAVSFENSKHLKGKSFVMEGAYELFSKMVAE